MQEQQNADGREAIFSMSANISNPSCLTEAVKQSSLPRLLCAVDGPRYPYALWLMRLRYVWALRGSALNPACCQSAAFSRLSPRSVG